MATIKVRGRGIVDVQADEAVVTFEAVAVADAAAEAFAAAAERGTALDAVLDEAGIEVARRATMGVVLQEHQEYDESGQRRQTHRASTTVTVRLDDAEAIAPLVAATVEKAGAYVRGPLWRISDPSAATAEACRRAIADATARAEAIAGALGARLGPVQSVEELPAMEAVPGMAFSVQTALEPPVYPGELGVSSVVDVVYELES